MAQTFSVRRLGSVRYRFRATVELLSPTAGGSYTSQQLTRVQSFRG